MWKLRQAIASFMYGRYGIDSIYWVLMGSWVVLSFINIFLNLRIIYFIGLAIITIALFRAFSKNIYARRREEEGFKKIFSLTKARIKDIKNKRYRKCKNCSAVVRLPIKRGKHYVKCPCCSMQFKVMIII